MSKTTKQKWPGKRIAALREHMGITQTEMAKKLGYHDASKISYLETNGIKRHKLREEQLDAEAKKSNFTD